MELWDSMSADDRKTATSESFGTEQPGAAIDNTVAMRQALATIEGALPPEAWQIPYVRANSERLHALLDKTREDQKAAHDVHAARLDKLMWRVVFEHAQKQRGADLEDARRQRDADMKAQGRHNLLTYLFSLAALIVSALAVVAAILLQSKA